LLTYITKEYPDSSAAYTALAKVYELSNNKELAMKNYKKARELNPKN
jgi:Tfp pilus assembly protein PilF